MKRDRFKNTTREERAECLKNVICPKCGYQNHYFYAKNMEHAIYVKQLLILNILKENY